MDTRALHEMLGEIHGQNEDEDAELSILRVFGDPREPRTMGRLERDTVRTLALIAARGQITGSPVRRALIENLFLMSRSEDAFGSQQMREVAASRREAREERGGFLANMFRVGGAGE